MDTISKGDKGPAVVLVQEGLTGWKADSLPRYGTDGDFGNETETAVKAFQAEMDLSQSGVVDGLTMGLLAMFMTGKKGPKGDPGEKGDKGDPGADAVLPDSIQIAIPPTIAEGHIGGPQ